MAARMVQNVFLGVCRSSLSCQQYRTACVYSSVSRTCISRRSNVEKYFSRRILSLATQSSDRQESQDQNFKKKRIKLLYPLLLGLSLFGKKKEDDPIPEVKQDKKTSTEAIEVTDDEVVLVLKHAKLAEMKRELDDSERLYHRALALLTMYQQNKTWNYRRIVQARLYVYDGMANLAMSRGQLDKAENLYKETLRGLIQQGVAKDDNSIVEISLKLAMIYAAQKRDAEATAGYKFCIDAQDKKVNSAKSVDDDTLALLGMSLDAYARYLIEQNRYKEALENLERALGLAITTLTNDHSQVAVLLNDIATVSSRLEDFDMAKEKLKQAVVIAEKVESSDLAVLYCNLGTVYVRQSDYAAAKVEYQKALKLAVKTGDKAAQQRARDGLALIKKQK